MSTCRSCKAEIRWVTMDATGKAMPLDPEPSEKGTIEIALDGQSARTVPTSEERLFPVKLYLSHYATCSDPERWRKKK